MAKLIAQRHAIILIAVACLASSSKSLSTADDFSSKFKITTKQPDDKVDLYPSVDKASIAFFSIQSPKGISSATIERTENEWRQPTVIRLHLKGLENLLITNGKTILEASVSSQGEKSKVRLWKDKEEDKPLDPKSPYWMEIRRIEVRRLDHDEKPTSSILVSYSCFEMQLPKKLFEDNPKSITISWIDFYR